MGDKKASITRVVVDSIREHAAAARPAECCGLLSGSDGVITDVHPLRNMAEQPQTAYFAAPEDLFEAMVGMRETGHKLLGIYHSHPKTAAYPSPKDVAMAFYPEAVYFIISLEPDTQLRAFTIDEARVERVRIVVVE